MHELLEALAVMTAAGSVVSLLLYVLAPFFSATWQYYSKFIVVLLLVLPLSLSFRSYEVVMHDSAQLESPAVIAVHSPERTLHLAPLPYVSGLGQEIHKNMLMNRAVSLQWLWLFGVLVTVMVKASSYYIFQHSVISHNEEITSGKEWSLLTQCKAEMSIKGAIRLAQNSVIGTPMLTGLTSPIIMIPIGIWTRMS